MKRLLTFIVVGGVGMLVNMGITYVGVQYLGLWYLVSFCFASLIGWTVIFIGNAIFTFPEHERHSYVKKYLAFIAGYLALFGVNAVLVFVFTSLLSIHYLVSIVLGSAITTLLTFKFSQKIIFR